MKKRQSNKFMKIGNWLLIWALATGWAVAAVPSSADSCQHPAPPVIVGSAHSSCRFETIVLSATGCAGTIIWSNGETGDKITIRPQKTTTYTAICRAGQGCISCFADGWKITVTTPPAPVVTASAKLICPGDPVTLTAANCAGTVRWSSQGTDAVVTGSFWTTRPQQSSTYQATCQQNACVSNPSMVVQVQTATPAIPVIMADRQDICAGQAVRLMASGCAGTVRWSDGADGLSRTVVPGTVVPGQRVTYQAVCRVGTCQSDSSGGVSVRVRLAAQSQTGVTTLTNQCPFQTADLSQTITQNQGITSASHQYEFRMVSSLSSPPVRSPGAVTAGTYYVFGRSTDGCYTTPAVVAVVIKACKNAIPPCLSNPATLVAQLDSLNWTTGVVRLRGQLGGSAEEATWQSSGDGLFADAGVNARYLLSENDRQRGEALFTLTTPDPDGAGPCVGASAQVAAVVPAKSGEGIGLSMNAAEPAWVTEKGSRLIELTYQLTAVNMGKNPLTGVRVANNLDAAFSTVGARLRSVRVWADSNLVVNSAYSGQGADTMLVLPGRLPIAGRSRIGLSVRVDVSQANTLMLLNRAVMEAVDVNGLRLRDTSTDGANADPDGNGVATDNSEPTRVTLQLAAAETDETVFIPEGFSPNNDGINDRFVIRYVPAGVVVHLEIFNRWGHSVYQNNPYKNDWDGTANRGIGVGSGLGQGLPDGTYFYQVRLSDGRVFSRFLTLNR